MDHCFVEGLVDQALPETAKDRLAARAKADQGMDRMRDGVKHSLLHV